MSQSGRGMKKRHRHELRLISKGHFGTIEWQITSRSSAEWEEQENEIEIDVVQEE